MGRKAMSAAFWNLGVLDGVLTTEAIRTAMRHFGNQPLTGAQVQWGLKHLTLTATHIKELRRGCSHRSPSPVAIMRRRRVKFQQWDGQWTVLTDWMALIRRWCGPSVEASAAKYAQEKGITPRPCP